MRRIESAFLLVVSIAFGFASCRFDESALLAADTKRSVFMTMTLGKSDTDIRRKIAEFRNENWTLTTSYANPSGTLFGVFERPNMPVDIGPELTALGANPKKSTPPKKWVLRASREYDHPFFDITDDTRLTLVFENGTFRMEFLKSRQEFQSGTVQYVKPVDKKLNVDLLIERQWKNLKNGEKAEPFVETLVEPILVRTQFEMNEVKTQKQLNILAGIEGNRPEIANAATQAPGDEPIFPGRSIWVESE